MVTGTEAWREAQASCPTNITIYDTLELRHPAIREGGFVVPARLYNGVEEKQFGIEVGSIYNPGTMQTFYPSSFGSSFPEFSERKAPETEISIDNISRRFTEALEDALGYDAELVVVWRQYSSTNLSEPCFGPLPFYIRNVQVSNSLIVGRGRLSNLGDKKFPSRVYTLKQFPTLIRG